MRDKAETPLQWAKRNNLPYVEITVDDRHVTGGTTSRGKIVFQSPVTAAEARAALKLILRLLDEKGGDRA